MARGDDDDLEDIRFLLQQEPLTAEELKAAFNHSRIPEIPEIEDLFRRAQPKVLALAQS